MAAKRWRMIFHLPRVSLCLRMFRSAADATASGVLRGQVNQTVDLIEKALGDGDISNMQFADTDGTIVVWSVRVDSITAVPDFGDGMAAVAVNGSIWWNK